jgi:hypothetical protein
VLALPLGTCMNRIVRKGWPCFLRRLRGVSQLIPRESTP